ncbi:MAG: acylneuraminate cytidylyltransferase family protein [Alphaproteobacteria bacterium]|nr:acylneuraminate cytidylyltransferase family protein [Alphaproteobacteria bacterium]
MVIPARGGSKRLRRKNTMDLGGKPLIAHTIEAAITAQCFDRVMVSTDDREIAAIARAYPGLSIDDRSPDLAGDRVKVVDVIHEICSRNEIRSEYDAIGMMLPTAPFRRKKDIQRGANLLTSSVDAVVSFAPYDFPPQMAVTLEGDDSFVRPLFEPSPLITGDTRSQDQAVSYRPNGSLYLSWIPSFLRYRSFFKGRVSGVVMTRLGSTDIDEQADMILARMLIESGLAESDFV